MSDEASDEAEGQSEQNGEDGNEQNEDTIIDSNLYGTTENYFEELIKIIGTLAQTTIHHDESLLNIPTGHTSTSEGSFSEQEASHLSQSLTQAWQVFPDFSKCVEAFKESDVYQDEIKRAMERGEIDEFEDFPQIVREDALTKLLNRYFQISESHEFEQDSFRQAYLDFESYLTQDKLTYRAKAPLVNFQSEKEEIELGENTVIKQIGRQQAETLSPRIRRRLTEDKDLHIIQHDYDVDKFGDGPIEKARETIDDVTLALRLFANKGDVDYPNVTVEPMSDFATNTNSVRMAIRTQFINSEYNLSSEETSEFEEFWTIVVDQLSEPDDNYRVALDKFQNSFQRGNENDRLLDCVIALEALYLKSGEQQEMSYRLSQRGALLLSEDEGEALEIKETLKEAYNKRSRLVHGSTADADRESVLRLHNLTRESLATFIEMKHNGKEHDDIIRELDEKASVPIS